MILLADDDRSVTASLSLLLKQAGHASRSAATPDEALAILREEPCELIIQDMNFTRRTSGEEGLALLKQIKAASPSTPVVLITAWGSIPLAVEGMKAGATDFISKPWTNQHMLQTVRTVLGLTRGSSGDPLPSRDELDGRFDFGHLLGNDPRILRVLQLIGRIAATDASVLVTGESGTGKELVADAIHRNSRRAARAFVKVNLGGIATSLFESEMFGHVRGAFTDARADRKGRFEIAHGGTIFLDEIGDLAPAAQVKLLRVLQDRTYEVLGSSQKREVDVRVIAATNRNLAEMVTRGEFREDLLYRVNLITIHLPPLRERPDDIPLLAGRFLQTLAHAHGRETLTLGTDAVAWIRAQPWPGNVRQLRQWIERAVLVSSRDQLGAGDFRASAEMESADAKSGHRGPAHGLPPVGSATLDEIERAMIEKALTHHGRNLTKVADSLGLSRAALYRRLEKYGISA
jgi:DNA-binding NtrC family response regulator